MKPIIFFLLILSIVFVSLNCEQEDLYTFMEENTKPEKVYIFSDSTTISGNLGGRSGANSICQSLYNSSFSGDFPAVKVKALISVNAGDQVKDLLPSNWWDIPVVGIHVSTKAETLLKSSWGELWSSPGILATLQTAAGLTTPHWTGSDSTGLVGTETCLGWTSGSNIDIGYTGSQNGTGTNWMYQNNVSCDTPSAIVCMAY